MEGVVQGLDPERIARAQQRLGPCIDDRKRPHATRTPDGSLTPSQVGAGQHLGIRGTGKRLPLSAQFLAQFTVVVNLTVKHHRDRPYFHGLCAALGQIDDRKAPVREPERPLRKHSLAVGPTMRERRSECREHALAIKHAPRIYVTTKSTHTLARLPLQCRTCRDTIGYVESFFSACTMTA